MRTRADVSVLLAPLLFAIACSGSDDPIPECTEGKCDVLAAEALAVCKKPADFATVDGSLKCTPCGAVLNDKSGRGLVPAFTANDALIKKVYMTFEDANNNKKIDKAEITCPVDMPAIMAKLEKTDKDNCNGVTTQVVSETAAKLGADGADYRAVTTRDCGNRGQFGLMFSSFGFSGDPSQKGTGIHITENAHPGGLEVIAFDEVDGVFNFYKEIDGKMGFFGSSIDFVAAGPGGPGLTSTRGCANCHPGGGVNMKELDSPWTHWSQEDNIVGADVLVASRTAFMGTLTSGANMQFSVTQPGNDKWNASKAKFLSTVTTTDLQSARRTLKDDTMSAGQKADLNRRQLKKKLNATQLMLEPLFCTVQVNINNSAALVFTSTRSGMSGPSPSFDSADVDAALAAIGSQVPGVGGAELTTPLMAFQVSHEDESYVNALVALAVIDAAFVQDVLMVDFTRPVFSDDRCALLALVPDLAPAERTASKIRDAVSAAIEAESPAAGSPAAQLLAHLKDANQDGHAATLATYTAACNGREPKTLLRDVLKVRSLHRQLAFSDDNKLDDAGGAGLHPFAVFEFAQTMAADNVRVSANPSAASVTEVALAARFSPVDCKLVSKFVATK